MNEISSDQVYILFKVAELAKRFGLEASDAKAFLSQRGQRGIELDFPDEPTSEDGLSRFKKMMSALGATDGV